MERRKIKHWIMDREFWTSHCTDQIRFQIGNPMNSWAEAKWQRTSKTINCDSVCLLVMHTFRTCSIRQTDPAVSAMWQRCWRLQGILQASRQKRRKARNSPHFAKGSASILCPFIDEIQRHMHRSSCFSDGRRPGLPCNPFTRSDWRCDLLVTRCHWWCSFTIANNV